MIRGQDEEVGERLQSAGGLYGISSPVLRPPDPVLSPSSLEETFWSSVSLPDHRSCQRPSAPSTWLYPLLAHAAEMSDNPADRCAGADRSVGGVLQMCGAGDCRWLFRTGGQMINAFSVRYQWKREQDFDFQLLEKAARDVEDREKEDQEWVHARAIHVTELDLEPQDYDLDISKELSTPNKVEIPERYVDLDPEEPMSREEQEARCRRAEKIKSILTRSSVHNLQPVGLLEELAPSDLDLQMQEQERMITISYALASEASQRSKQVAAHAVYDH